MSVLLAGSFTQIYPLQGARAAEWEPFPTTQFVNDFGGVGLIQTPTARMASEGQLNVGASRVYPYERYFVTVQATSWLEATLRYSSVANRFYGPEDFSGDQSYKDRGLDMKLRLTEEGKYLPSIAVGGRDFLGTGLFSSEYVVLSKSVAAADLSLGIGWGNMGARGHFKNPLRLISSSFGDRGGFTAGGGTLNNSYFKGDRVALFGGIRVDTPIRGLTAKLEYDPNDYQTEALGNRFDVDSPINVGLDYSLLSWLHVGAAFERGNRLGVKLVLTTNFNRRSRMPKIDPPAPALPRSGNPVPDLNAGGPAGSSIANDGQPLLGDQTPRRVSSLVDEVMTDVPSDRDAYKNRLMAALSEQGSGLYAANFEPRAVTIYVAQTRFRNMATGLGRIARAAFTALPMIYSAVTVVFVEGGVETMSATIFRSDVEKAVSSRGSPDELFVRTQFSPPPLALDDANFIPETRPGFYYSFRPGLRTTLGRPEQFILYQLFARANASLELGRGLSLAGSFGVNLSDNFDQLRIPSDSVLPRVRSDIKEYLRQGKTSIPYLQADYSFNISPSVYGHVYGGLLEEMFAGVGGEVLYRPYDANWAIGVEMTYAHQRDFDQFFDLRNYNVVTGHVTGFMHFETLNLDAQIKAGRYLAKDWGGTFQLSRTFKSGISVGAFATFTNVSAEEFGEGRFDKGLFILVPLDILYIRNVRSGIGLLWRPLIRDGGQMVIIRRPLLATTGAATMYNLRRDWRDILD